MREDFLSAIRTFEGFTARGVWDHKQVSSGYGTRAKFAGETIDEAEAERRFRQEIAEAHKSVMKFAPSLDEGSAAALTSLTFNAGPSWMRSGLGEAVKTGDLDQMREVFKMYNKASGVVLPGLVTRRAAEAEWIGSGASTGAVHPVGNNSNSSTRVGSGVGAGAPSHIAMKVMAPSNWRTTADVLYGEATSASGELRPDAAAPHTANPNSNGATVTDTASGKAQRDLGGMYDQVALMMIGMPRLPPLSDRRTEHESRTQESRKLQLKIA